MRRSLFPRGLATAIAFALVLSAAPVRAASPTSEFGMGTAAALTNLLYGPTKVLYALGGGMVATIAFVFSGGDRDVARPIVNASLRGDYVLTPDHLRGKERWEFVGRTPAAAAAEEMEGGGDWGGGDDSGF
jgi:hypothetical protein